LIVGTRGSLLARTQTGWVIDRLRALHPGLEFETKLIVTSGDRFTDASLAAVGGKGAFVKEIEEALLAGEIHLAVHSMKDLPGAVAEGLAIGAVPVREDPRDAWICRTGHTLATLPPGSRVGSTSLRRAAQVLSARPDLRVEPIRGNIDTRLRKAEEGVVDATLLAVAGLNRAGFAARATAILDKSAMVPAAAQAALAVEIRAGDAETARLVGALSDASAVAETAAERRLVAMLGGSCNAPIGANAEHDRAGRTLTLRAVVLSADGRRRAASTRTGPDADPEGLAATVHAELVAAGARELLAECEARLTGGAERTGEGREP
jgi:hydroxymethylbilane synthase